MVGGLSRPLEPGCSFGEWLGRAVVDAWGLLDKLHGDTELKPLSVAEVEGLRNGELLSGD